MTNEVSASYRILTSSSTSMAWSHSTFMRSASFPDKAIDVVSLAMVRAEKRGAQALTADLVDEVVSEKAGVPVRAFDATGSERLLAMDKRLSERVVGQQDAVGAVARAVKRSFAGLASRNRPIGSFLFLGLPGVGKTELAKAVAGDLLGDDKALVRFDMSEYQEAASLSRLIGAPPGYVGHDEGGQLTSAVKDKPFSVVLLDEIEKAHPDVLNVLLQILGDGRATDGRGRTVDFTNTVVILTSNLLQELSARGASDDEVRAALKKTGMRPELVDRLAVVLFKPLEQDAQEAIIRLRLRELARGLAEERKIALDFDDSLVAKVIALGVTSEFGARHVQRTIDRLLSDTLADAILSGQLQDGKAYRLGWDQTGLHIGRADDRI